ncbi:MAG TPA: hypothetical protein VHD63_16440, partial [Ktedonobacteraceae bacterium]|nr:hypothetical protein [Ktedonobacteraceae bacterium]
MSTNHSNSAPDPGAPQEQETAASPANGEQTIAGPRLSIDPQQPFREYTTPAQGLPSGPPAYAPPVFYQPGYPGQTPGTPGAPGASGLPGAAGTPPPPHNGMPVPGSYAAYPGQTGAQGAPGAPGTPPPPHSGMLVSGPYAAYYGQTPGGPVNQPGYPFQGAYQPVQGQAPYYPGYYYPYGQPGGPMYGYGWMLVPEKPKRDTYQLVVSIVAFICSILIILGGLVSLLMVGLVDLAQSLSATLSDGTYFAGIILFLAFALAGIVGGSFCLYHSIRALFLRKPSAPLW